MKIACCGTHGAGKSTLTYQIAEYYKRNAQNVYVIHERVRESCFPINDEMSENTAIWAFTSQINKELTARQQGYTTIICDRSYFDTFIYADFFRLKKNPINHFRIASEEWLESYDYFFFVRPDMPLISDGVRDCEDIFQNSIDKLFEDFFSHIDVNYYKEVFTSQIFNKEIDFERVFLDL